MLTMTINGQAVQLTEIDCLELIDCLRNEINPAAFEPFERSYTTKAGDAVNVACDRVLPHPPAHVPTFKKMSVNRHLGNTG